jgi:ribose 5-phosphate isomerase RpiB
LAADHGGFDLKEELAAHLRAAGHEVIDFGAHNLSQAERRLRRLGKIGSLEPGKTGQKHIGP